MMAGIKGFHRGADRGFAIVDQQQVRVADVLEVEFDDLIGRIDLMSRKLRRIGSSRMNLPASRSLARVRQSLAAMGWRP